MAEQKHKSKYKAPKDMEKSHKIAARKDLKDYTHEDKDGAQNPYSTGKNKQELVPRKTDKPVIDDVENMVPDMKDMDRLYKDLEDAEYDTDHARKVLKKRQEDDTEEYMDKRETTDHGVTTLPLEEKLRNISEEDRERLVREYFRRKIAQALQEQEMPGGTPAVSQKEELDFRAARFKWNRLTDQQKANWKNSGYETKNTSYPVKIEILLGIGGYDNDQTGVVNLKKSKSFKQDWQVIQDFLNWNSDSQSLQEQPAPPPPPAAPEAPTPPATDTATQPAEAEDTEQDTELIEKKSIPEMLNDLRRELVAISTDEGKLADIWSAFLIKLTKDADPKQKKNIWKQIVFKANREINS